jgi:hypothetical protein
MIGRKPALICISLFLGTTLLSNYPETSANACEGDSCVRVIFYTGYKCTIVPYWCEGAGMSLITACVKENTINGTVVGNCMINWHPPVE